GRKVGSRPAPWTARHHAAFASRLAGPRLHACRPTFGSIRSPIVGTSLPSLPRKTAPTGFGTRASARPAFVTTHWSVVLAAGRQDTTRARDALATLCQVYWYPLYAYVRRRGYSPHDAQDLAQEFFARLLQKNTLGAITREKGKFRSFLLPALNHFMVDQWRKARTGRRGGGGIVSLDARDAETRLGREPVDALTPEKSFEQNWALALL